MLPTGDRNSGFWNPNRYISCFLGFHTFLRKKESLLSVRLTVCQDPLSQERLQISNWNSNHMLRSTAPWFRDITMFYFNLEKSYGRLYHKKPVFRHYQGNQNSQCTSGCPRIMKFKYNTSSGKNLKTTYVCGFFCYLTLQALGPYPFLIYY